MKTKLKLTSHNSKKVQELFLVEAEVAFNKAVLDIQWTIKPLQKNKVLAAQTNDHPLRKNNLWQTTCSEFFLKTTKQSQYFEGNFSPSGDWNFYEFESYRAQINETSSLELLSLSSQLTNEIFNLAVKVKLADSLIAPKSTDPDFKIMMSLNQIIEDDKKNKSYWALKHCAPQPDFHLAQSFTLDLYSGKIVD